MLFVSNICSLSFFEQIFTSSTSFFRKVDKSIISRFFNVMDRSKKNLIRHLKLKAFDLVKPLTLSWVVILPASDPKHQMLSCLRFEIDFKNVRNAVKAVKRKTSPPTNANITKTWRIYVNAYISLKLI